MNDKQEITGVGKKQRSDSTLLIRDRTNLSSILPPERVSATIFPPPIQRSSFCLDRLVLGDTITLSQTPPQRIVNTLQLSPQIHP